MQVYTSLPGSAVERPIRELKGFGRIDLAAGETSEVTVTVRREDLTYWDTRLDRWVLEPGTYDIHVGASSRDLRVTVPVTVAGEPVMVPITRDSSLGEVYANPRAAAALKRAVDRNKGSRLAASPDPDMQMMMASFPIGRMGMFGFSPDEINRIIEESQ